MRHLPSSLLAPLLAAALAACGGSPGPADDAEAQEPCVGPSCDEGGPAVDSDPGDGDLPLACDDTSHLDLYTTRIEPLLSDNRPSSCNKCHLAGVHLNQFVTGSACEAMSCLVAQDLVDFEAPEESTILSWIGRARPESTAITDEVVEAEYEGFLQWITYSAACHDEVCAEDNACSLDVPGDGVDADGLSPCLPDDPREGCHLSTLPCAEHDPRPACRRTSDRCQPGDPRPECVPEEEPCAEGDPRPECDPCSEQSVADLFVERVFPWRGRCAHCHEVGSPINAGSPPKWLEVEDTREAAIDTIANIEGLEVVDVQAPHDSLLLLKPLAEDAGGVEHGGSTKFVDTEDPSYLDFVIWIERYAECERADNE